MKNAKTEDDKLALIAEFVMTLEILHFFMDGNQRTTVFVILNKLLIENGLTPVIMPDPSVFDGYMSSKELVGEIKKGMKNTADLIESLEKKNTINIKQ